MCNSVKFGGNVIKIILHNIKKSIGNHHFRYPQLSIYVIYPGAFMFSNILTPSNSLYFRGIHFVQSFCEIHTHQGRSKNVR